MDTAPYPSAGTWGKFVLQFSVSKGPCLAAGAIRTYTIASGGTGYVVGDTGTIGGGGATYNVTTLTGTSVRAITVAVPYGSGYTVSNGVSTTATSGNGSGLAINITGIYTGTPGPNCVTVEDQTQNGGWVSAVCNNASCSNGDSVTFAHVNPATSALDGTYRTDYASTVARLSPVVFTPGSGQTPGKYFIYPTGGGGTGMEIFVTVNAAGTVTARPVVQWYGNGYNSCPTVTLMAGGTPATFGCKPSTTPAYTFDTSMAAGTNYFQLTTLNDTFGMTTDQAGNVWSVYSEAYPNQLNIGESYVSIQKSTNGGVSYGPGRPLLIDSGTHCGRGTVPCSYVTGSLATAPNGNLVVGYWTYDNSGSPLTPPVQCCWTIYCNPASVDCSNSANWSTPYRFPLKKDPAGLPCQYNIFMTNQMPNGELGMGMTDGNYAYISISCDNGQTWSTGIGCVSGTNTLIAITDPSNCTPSCGAWTKLPSIEYTFGWIGRTTLIMFDRNNDTTYSGGVGSCIYPQLTCGPLVFGYSTNMGTTWHIAQSSLTPFHGSITTGIFNQIAPYLINTNQGGLWTVFWIERDENPGANIYLLSSTFSPASLISNLSSWSEPQSQYLWYFTPNPNPSSPAAAMVGPGKVAYQWNSGTGPTGMTLWHATGIYTHPGFTDHKVKTKKLF